MISTQACSQQGLAPGREFEAEERESPAKEQDSAIERQRLVVCSDLDSG